MKYHFLLIAFFFVTLNIGAQTTEKPIFKSAVKSKEGKVIADSTLIVKISVIKDNPFGEVLFVESQTVRSNASGVITIELGKGAFLEGSMDSIDWANTPIYLKLEFESLEVIKIFKLKKKQSDVSSPPANIPSYNDEKAKQPLEKQAIPNPETVKNKIEVNPLPLPSKSDSILSAKSKIISQNASTERTSTDDINLKNNIAQENRYTLHTIKSGETLAKIAKQHSTTVATILELNKMKPEQVDFIRAGQKIKIPKTNLAVKSDSTSVDKQKLDKTPIPEKKLIDDTNLISNGTPEKGYTLHTIQSGETLAKIAKQHSTTVATILELNKMKPEQVDFIRAGQKIKIPKSNLAVKSNSSSVDKQKLDKTPIPEKKLIDDTNLISNGTPEKGYTLHTIQSGETLAKIAKQHSTTIAHILELNKMKREQVDFIQAGQEIKIPATTKPLPAKLSPGKVDSIKTQAKIVQKEDIIKPTPIVLKKEIAVIADSAKTASSVVNKPEIITTPKTLPTKKEVTGIIDSVKKDPSIVINPEIAVKPKPLPVKKEIPVIVDSLKTQTNAVAKPGIAKKQDSSSTPADTSMQTKSSLLEKFFPKLKKEVTETQSINTTISIPDKITYQTLIKNVNGGTYPDAPVEVKLAVMKDSPRGQIVFEEVHNAISDSTGMIKLNLGKGNHLVGEVDSLKWNESQYFIKTVTKPTGITKIDKVNNTNITVEKGQTISNSNVNGITPDTTSKTLTQVTKTKKDSVVVPISINEEETPALIQELDENIENTTSETNDNIDWEVLKYRMSDQNKIIESNPTNANAYLKRASIKTELKDYRGALSDTKKAIELDSLNAENYYVRACIYEAAQKDQLAIEDYSKAIIINPKQAPAYARRALLKKKTKDYTGALNDINLALIINPDSVSYRTLKAQIKGETGDFVGGIFEYNIAISQKPNDANLYIERGILKIKNDAKTEAILDFDEAIKIAPKNDETYYWRGIAKEDLNDIKGALTDFEKSISIEPANIMSLFHAGLMEYKLKNYEKSIVYYDDVIKRKKDWAQAYYHRGVLKLEIKDKTGGCEDLYKASQLGLAKANDAMKNKCD